MKKICGDCHQEITRHYVLTVETWYEMTNKSTGEGEYICAACVEKVIGRPLQPSDFMPTAAVNYVYGFLGVEKDALFRAGGNPDNDDNNQVTM